MNINELYNIAEKENLTPYKYDLGDNIYGCYVEVDNKKAIAINYDIIKNSAREKEVLAEELGHYFCGAVYPMDQVDTKQEYKAKKFSYTLLIPIDELRQAINGGTLELWSLAEKFGVTCEFMQKCVEFYNNTIGSI